MRMIRWRVRVRAGVGARVIVIVIRRLGACTLFSPFRLSLSCAPFFLYFAVSNALFVLVVDVFPLDVPLLPT